MRFFAMLLIFLGLCFFLTPTKTAESADFVVYNIHQVLSLGNPGEVSQKDFYINMGIAHGVKVGSSIEVLRRISSYDVINQSFYRQVAFRIARLKVIHAEADVSIARLDKFSPVEEAPVASPRAVMVGDAVRLISR